MSDDRQDEAKQAARQAALDYHEFPKPGKLEIRATKPLANGRDLSRAYSPGVAEACLEKFGGDSVGETARNHASYLAAIPASMRTWDDE